MRTWLLLLFAPAIGLLAAGPGAATPAPGREWRTLRVACCDVHYDAEIDGRARHVAALADEVVAAVEELLDSPLQERVHLLLSDATDSPNGFTRPIPFNRIELFAIHPDEGDDLARTDDWMRMLLTHEMLHLVHINTTQGLPVLINALIGKWWLPNFVLPDWLLEGMATYAETALTAGGRLRSASWRAALLTAAVQGDLWQLDDVSNFSRRPPSSSTSRLYGGYFLLWLTERLQSDGFIAEFAHDYGARLIPYGIHRSLESAAGVDIDRAWQEFLADIRAEAFALRETIDARGGLTPARRLTRTGGTYAAPDFSPEGDLIFALNPLQGRTGVYRIRGLPDAVPVVEPLFRSGGSAIAEALPGGEVLVSMSEWWWNHWAFRDLFRVAPGQTPRRLSDGARIRTPAVFGDGRRALAEARTAGASRVLEVDVATGRTHEVLAFTDGRIAFTPVPSPDGQRFVYSLLTPGGTRDLVEREFATGVERRITQDAAVDTQPTWTPDGRWIVFSSDRDGLLNLYAWNRQNESIVRVTDLIGAATDPVVTPDGRAVVFVGRHLDGEDLYVAALDLDAAPLAEPSTLAVEDTPIRPVPPPVTVASEPYNPFPTLLARNWLPVLAEDARGAPALGVAVNGGDVAEFYSWTFDGRWGLGTGRPMLQGSLRFEDFFFPLTLDVEHRSSFGAGVRRNPRGEPEEQRALIYRAGASFRVPVRRWLRSHALSFGYVREWHFVENVFTGPGDLGELQIPPSSNIGTLRLGWTYSSDERYRDSVSAERGFDVTVRGRISNQWTFSELDLYEVTFDTRAYHAIPRLRNHALAVYLSGGVAIGNRLRRANYYLGGFGDRSIVKDAVDGPRFGAGYLRGFPANSQVGDSFLLGTLEYRFPIWEVERGIGSLPLFLSRIHGAVYGDLGDAFDGVFQPRRLQAGVGVEARAHLVVGYKGHFFVRTGIARGLMRGGVEQPYFVMGVPF